MRQHISRLLLTIILALGLGAPVGVAGPGPSPAQVADPGGSAGGNGG